MIIRIQSRFLLALALSAAPAMAAETGKCRVLDPELQGRYEGGCDRDGLADGHGSANGSASYEGEFSKGKKHGVGRKTWTKTGDVYEGEFRDDYRDGWGRYSWGKQTPWAGQWFEGQYVKDRREGYGAYFWANGDKFIGEWRNDLRYGESFMETRRRQLSELVAQATSQAGVSVCREVLYGIGNRGLLRAKLVASGPTSRVVELDEASQALGLYSQPRIELWNELYLWQTCS